VHRDHQRLLREPAACQCVGREQGENLIAVEDVAVLIAQDAAIAVAVVGDAQARARRAHAFSQPRRVLAPHAGIDVAPVGPVAEADDFRPEAAEHGGAARAGRSIGRVEHDPPARERVRCQDPRGRCNVVGQRARIGPAGRRPGGPGRSVRRQQRLDLALLRLG